MLKYSLATHFISYYAKSFHCDLHLVGKESILDLAHSVRHNTECIKLYFFWYTIKITRVNKAIYRVLS